MHFSGIINKQNEKPPCNSFAGGFLTETSSKEEGMKT